MSRKIFQGVELDSVRRSKFDLSHEVLNTCKFGQLKPNFIQEVLPGDTWSVKTENLTRLAPPISPVMHRIDIFQHYFFVPNRIVWSDWEEHITGAEDGQSAIGLPKIGPTQSNIDGGDIKQGSLWDCLGLPTFEPGATPADLNALTVSSLPFRAYQKIYNEYYRDQNFVSELDVETAGFGQLTQLKTRAFEKDYFTSALPWAQRGDASVLPLTIDYHNDPLDNTPFGHIDFIEPESGQTLVNNMFLRVDSDGRIFATNGTGASTSEDKVISLKNIQSAQFTINDLRTANKLQEWLEKSARAGSRYSEQLLAHFGVKSSDARLQRPEYLGGGKQPIVISEIPGTAGYNDGVNDIPQGNLAGHGISTGSNNGFTASFEEHGYIIGIYSIIPRTSYYQGIHRHWRRDSRYDYYFPEFADLGEQDIKNYEIYVDITRTEEQNEETFGYQQRFAEYKYQQNRIHGLFKTTGLEHYHLARKFNSRPTLGASFIHIDESAEDFDRIFAVQDQTDYFWSQMYHHAHATRKMPFFSTPDL